MSCWVEILENLKVSVSDVNTCVANTHWQHSQVLALPVDMERIQKISEDNTV